MKARQLIGGASYSPETLKVLYKAFDDGWVVIAPTISGRAEAIEAARLKLANIILSLAKEDSRHSDQIKNKALRIFRLKPKISN